MVSRLSRALLVTVLVLLLAVSWSSVASADDDGGVPWSPCSPGPSWSIVPSLGMPSTGEAEVVSAWSLIGEVLGVQVPRAGSYWGGRVVIAWADAAGPIPAPVVSHSRDARGATVEVDLPEDFTGVLGLMLKASGVAHPTSRGTTITAADKAALHAACAAATTVPSFGHAPDATAATEAAPVQGVIGGRDSALGAPASARSEGGLPRIGLVWILFAAAALGLGAGPGLERLRAGMRRPGSPAAKTADAEV